MALHLLYRPPFKMLGSHEAFANQDPTLAIPKRSSRWASTSHNDAQRSVTTVTHSTHSVHSDILSASFSLNRSKRPATRLLAGGRDYSRNMDKLSSVMPSLLSLTTSRPPLPSITSLCAPAASTPYTHPDPLV